MTGMQKAMAIIALVMIAMAAFNWSLWRRLKAAQVERAGWTPADFDAQLVANGVSAEVARVTRELVQPYYGAEIAPHPDDGFARFLGVDETAVADLAGQGFGHLGLPLPDPETPGMLPRMTDVRDLAEYLQSAVERERGQG